MEKIKIRFLDEFRELFNKYWRYIVFYGGRSSGKSRQVAMALILRSRSEKLRILCTREIQKTIKDSVHKLLSDIIEENGFNDFEIEKDSIRNIITGSEFIFKGLKLNINEIKSTEGIDIGWVEEAQSVSEVSLNILTPTIRKPGSQIIFTFNRFTDLDPVYTRFVMNRPAKTYVRKVNYDVLEGLGLLPDVIKLEIEEDRKNPDLFAYKWLGEPLSQNEFSVINREKILDAMRREVKGEGSVEIGVDVARMGNDRTVLWKIQGLKTLDYKVYTQKKTTEICDLIEGFAGSNKKILIKIDDTGVGGGITDEMIKRGYKVYPMNFGSKAHNSNKYPNLISEAWFRFNDMLDKVSLPMDQDLLMELSTRNWEQDIKGRRIIESKDKYKKRGFRSPDLADAVMIAYYRVPEPQIIMF